MEDQGRSSRWLVVGVTALIAVGLGFYTGVAVEKSGNSDTETAAGGSAIGASDIGEPTAGRELFVTKGCAMCHQFMGEGGTDAPALDFMTGHMSAVDIADMSGQIWNHVPAMQHAFEEEDIPFPTFKPGEMNDLIAYLHGGGEPPMMNGGAMDGGDMGGDQGMGGGK